MSTPALYDVLHSFKDIHKVVLNLAEDLDDEQLNWKPEGYSNSIGFHLWHLARETDYLKAAILYHNPQFVPEFGDGKEIWENESLAQKWGFTEEYHQTVGTGLSDEVAATLPIPKKDELLGYLRNSYETIECFIEQLDSKYPNFENVDEELKKNIEMIRVNLLVFLSHDCRHLSMMECRQGLQTPHASIPHSRGVRGRPGLARQRRRDSVTPALPGTGRQDGVRPVQVLRGVALDATTTLAPYASAVSNLLMNEETLAPHASAGVASPKNGSQ